MVGIFSKLKIERDERINEKYDAIVQAIVEMFPDDMAYVKGKHKRKIYAIIQDLATAIEDI